MARIRVLVLTAGLLAAAPGVATALPAPLVLTQDSASRQGIARADTQTLRPRGRVARLPAAAYAVETAPDGRRLAALTVFEDRDGGDQGFGLSFVGTRSWRLLGSLRLGRPFTPVGIAWLRADRLLVVGSDSGLGSAPRLLLVDPLRRRVVRRVRLGGLLTAAAQVGDRLAVAADPVPPEGALDGTGPTVVHLLDADGATAATASVPESETVPTDGGGTDLEVDPRTGQLLAVTDGAAPQIAAIDPLTGAVTLRQIARAGGGGIVTWRGPRTLVTTRPRGGDTLRTLDDAGAQTGVRILPARAQVSQDGTLVTAAGSVATVDGRWRRRVRGADGAERVGSRVVVVAGRRITVLDAADGRVLTRPRPPRGTRLVTQDADGERGGEPLFLPPQGS